MDARRLADGQLQLLGDDDLQENHEMARAVLRLRKSSYVILSFKLKY
jgi:predicted ABC-type transport system involved in lysophospholipase L1 biosynthesis ATPase subunit